MSGVRYDSRLVLSRAVESALPSLPRLVSVKEFAAALGCSVKTVKRRTASGRGFPRPIAAGKRWMFSEVEVRRYIEGLLSCRK